LTVWEWLMTGALLIAACWTDFRRMQIPNRLTISFMGAGMLYQGLFHGIQGLGWAVGGMLCGLIPLYIMHRLGGIGGGDVKWFAAFGAWAGPSPTFGLLLLSILFGGGIACSLLVLRVPGVRVLGRKMRWPWGQHPVSGGRNVKFPFMLAVAPGFVTLLGKG
jgi:Flp pilus assembly protein protease CpaA